MLATQPVVDASRPSFEVGEDLVDPRQDEVSGGLPDDMDIVAIGGDRSVAGPAVGFRDGVGIGGGFDEVSEVMRRRRRRFRQPRRARDVSVPEFMAPTMEWEGRSGMEGWPRHFHQARQRVALSTMLARSLWASSQALRSQLFLELQGRMPLEWVPSGSNLCSASQAVCGSVDAAGSSRARWDSPSAHFVPAGVREHVWRRGGCRGPALRQGRHARPEPCA